MEEGDINMKVVYILIMLVVAASVLGCVDKKAPDSSIRTPATPAPVSPTQTSIPSDTVSDTEQSDMDDDLLDMDSMFNESGMDISFSEINADAFI